MGCHSGFLPLPRTTYTPPCASTSHPGSYPVLQHLPGLLQQLPFPMSILHKAPKGILLKCSSDSCLMPSSHTPGRSSSFHLAVLQPLLFLLPGMLPSKTSRGNSFTACTLSQAHSLTPLPTREPDTDSSCAHPPPPPSIYPTSVLIAVFPSPDFSFRGSSS